MQGCGSICQALYHGRPGGKEIGRRLCCFLAARARRRMDAHMKIILAALLLFSAQGRAQPDARLVEDLVAANRILAHEGILAEGWGHVSVRLSRDRFLISTAVAPEMVQAS